MPEPDNTRGKHPPNTSYPAGLKLPSCSADLTQPGASRLFSSTAIMTQVADDFVIICLSASWVTRSWLVCGGFVYSFVDLFWVFWTTALVWVLVVVLGGLDFWDSTSGRYTQRYFEKDFWCFQGSFTNEIKHILSGSKHI